MALSYIKTLILTGSMFIVAGLACIGTGCGRSDSAGTKDPTATTHVPPRNYQLRGIITVIPDGHSLKIRHEPIDDFVDNFGDVVGMSSMTMPFEVAPELPLGELSPGDKIAFDWSVDWGKNAHRITRLTKLPPDTELHFGPAHPPAATSTAPSFR